MSSEWDSSLRLVFLLAKRVLITKGWLMDRVDSHTPDLTQENIERLARLFPDAVTESMDAEGRLVRGIDFDVLKQDLSGSLIDGSRERYRFTWPGKRAAKLLARTPVDLALRPCVDRSVDWDRTGNVYVEGDNLDALKLLRETYAGKVKLIYIDPPYNTGHDFVYRDDFSVSAADYEGVSGGFRFGWEPDGGEPVVERAFPFGLVFDDLPASSSCA